ncbi:hypothetical protein Zmor_027711 [Zophobas morio]|uniref:Uncharacterized protein n=1 Tax=Zophobas morio TaxID=2755281 RepID=A0AA38M2T0_9CUCU|nr:hypothetical protein Zmor_027711 [Zophobas morio]
MCEEDNFFIRGLELYQLSLDEDSCSTCLLKRSNAVRRRKRPSVKIRKSDSDLSETDVFSRKRHVPGVIPSHMISNRVMIIGDMAARYFDFIMNLKNLNLPKPRLDGKKIKKFLRGKLYEMSYSKDITIPWFLLWKYRKIHPVRGRMESKKEVLYSRLKKQKSLEIPNERYVGF